MISHVDLDWRRDPSLLASPESPYSWLFSDAIRQALTNLHRVPVVAHGYDIECETDFDLRSDTATVRFLLVPRQPEEGYQQ